MVIFFIDDFPRPETAIVYVLYDERTSNR